MDQYRTFGADARVNGPGGALGAQPDAMTPAAQRGPSDSRRPEDVPPPFLPAPSLPDGGGSLRGIGEKFSVAPARGAATLTVPFSLSPGRAGQVPQLSLSYDTGGGNSPFGLGFSLALPRISRRTSHGVPDYTDDDVYILSDTEDLVPRLVPQSGGTWVADIASETLDTVAYTVERYRPRVEGAYSRIERCVRVADGDVFWRVVSRANVTSLFGRSPQARVADPADPTRVAEWLLEQTADDRGNVTTYTYKAEDLTGVDATSLHERHRLDGTAPSTAARYIKTISYGNLSPGVPSPACFLVVFDYGEHDQTPAQTHPWTVRQDPYSWYRYGFEVRIRRLCRRVLMFHDLPAEFGAQGSAPGPNPRLVRSTDLAYAPDPVATTLASIAHTGYDWNASTSSYDSESMPPVELSYTASAPDTVARPITTVRAGSPVLADPDVRGPYWVDLDGEGIPGALTHFHGAWWYQRNLGGGTLDEPEPVRSTPALGAPEGRLTLLDLSGDGRASLVQYGPHLFGASERLPAPDGFAGRGTEVWAPFRPFESCPAISFEQPGLKHVDLTGDGLADLAIGTGDGLTWHPGLGAAGFGPAIDRVWPHDEEQGPPFGAFDPTGRTMLADLSGDGLVDLVRIRNGEVCYWPALGYGRFGAKVCMDGAPVFEVEDVFDPNRIRLADIDGTGPADLVYLGRDGAWWWRNLAGNGFGPVQPLPGLPPVDGLAAVDVVDLLGTGTACLVWSSPLPGRPAVYLDLARGSDPDATAGGADPAGHKPWLLRRVTANTGAQTVIAYAPSTRFYLADKAAGRPWATRLPFPVQVVAQRTVGDAISGASFTSGYSYRHGYFDGVEREFRGFGMVEHVDADVFTDPPDLADLALAGDLPPVRTREWFHTGSYENVLTDIYAGDAQAMALDGPEIDPAGAGGPADGEEYRQALRALAGSPLRSEVYAQDGTAAAIHPYTVTEHRHRVVRLQPRGQGPGRYAAFQAFERESLGYEYERDPADPRIAHLLTLDVDRYGTVLSHVAVGYARRLPQLPEQGAVRVQWSQETVVDLDDATGYRPGSPVEHRDYEITGLPDPGAGRFTVAGLSAALAGAVEIPFESLYTGPAAPPGQVSKRCVADQRQRYWADDLSAPLPLGQAGTRALAWQTYRLALTPGLLTAAYGTAVSAATLAAEGGYIQEDGGYWSGTGSLAHDPAGFYLPLSQTSSFGSVSSVRYDPYRLLPVSATASAVAPYSRLTSSYDNDYRVLGPKLITDPNGNRRSAAYSPYGLVTLAWVMGKDGSSDGDTAALPGAVYEYGLDAWRTSGQPLWVQSDRRERHADAASPWQRARAHTDGLGRIAMQKVQAEPGLAWSVDGQGRPVQVDTGSAPRWIGTGRTVYNNKGLAVEKYEPYFSTGPVYEYAAALVKQGVTPVSRFDPIGRLIRTDHPDGSVSTVEFDPWQQVTRDAGDNVLTSPWYAQRHSGGASAADQRAATLAAAYADTPTTALLDSLGRTVRTLVDNGPGGVYTTVTTLDLHGNILTVTDPRGVPACASVYDVTGRPLATTSADAGRCLVLPDCDGQPIRRIDALGHIERYAYDPLRRPLETWVQDPAQNNVTPPERLTDLAVYGEQNPNAVALNLLGRVHRRYDQAGLEIAQSCDFKGNVLSRVRQLTTLQSACAGTAPDWSALHGQPLSALDGLTAALLDPETFTGSGQFDGLNRPTSTTLPDGSRIQPRYSAAGLLTAITAFPGTATAATAFVSDIEHDAKGRRLRVTYGCGATTAYTYDPLTSRLTGLVTTGAGAAPPTLQNFAYTYDCVGNVVEVDDLAAQTQFFAGAVIAPGARFTFDPLYRLATGSGREHRSLGAQPDSAEPTYEPLPHPNDAQAVRAYVETYTYDQAGNILSLAHAAGPSATWTRRYTYDTASDRLLSHSRPADPPNSPGSAVFTHDANGRMTAMPHLPGALAWDFSDRLVSVGLGGGGGAHYAHNAEGMRVRKAVVRSGGLTEETIQLAGCEFFRRYSGGVLVFERRTVHIMDGGNRVALAETVTVDTAGTGPGPAAAIRYQFGDRLGSCVLELDDTAAPISYEEYHPYGTTALWMARGAARVSTKRYRYSGKEKDDETALYYFGARYYACWLCRWASADPAGEVDGTNLYAYARDNPVVRIDPDGRESAEKSNVRHNAENRERGALSGDEIGDIYKDVTDVPEDLQLHTPTVHKVLTQQRRLARGTAKRAAAAKDPKNKPPTSQQLWAAAEKSAEDWAVKRVAQALPLKLQPTVQPLVDQATKTDIPEHPTNLYDYEMRDSYDAMQHALTVADVAISIVAPMIGESIVESGVAQRAGDSLRNLYADTRGAVRIPPFGSVSSEAGELAHEAGQAGKLVAPGNPRLAPGANAGSHLKGHVGEAASRYEKVPAGYRHVGGQITLDVEGGKRIRIDNIFEKDGFHYGVESKFGPSARPTPNQAASIPASGGVVVAMPAGENAVAAGLRTDMHIQIHLSYQYWDWPVN